MADVVLDANVLVGLLDANDSLHTQARFVVELISANADQVALLDLCVAEAVAVLGRRAAQRKANPPDLAAALAQVRAWYQAGRINFMQTSFPQWFATVLDVVEASQGALNVNDSFLVVLQREGMIGLVATFDRSLAAVEGFRSFDLSSGTAALLG